MFGSKKSELTRKYSSSSLEAITFGLNSSVRVAYSTKPTATNSERQHDEHEQAGPQPPRRPLDLAQQREEQRERHVEEDGLLERDVDGARVGRLQRVEHDGAREQPLERAVRVRRVVRLRVAHPRHGPGERAGGDHEVERDEQVRGLPAGLDGDPERQRGERGERQHRRPAVEEHRERDDDDRGGDQPAAEREQRPVAHDVELRRVPDLRDQQHRRERQRGEHRPRAGAAAAAEHRGRGERRGDDDPDHAQPLGRGGDGLLDRRGVIAGSSGSSARGRAGCRRRCA